MRLLSDRPPRNPGIADHRREALPVAVDPMEAIRSRAHQLYLTRDHNGAPGDAISDWLSAEREMAELARRQTLMRGGLE